jgi:hypothetical protein
MTSLLDCPASDLDVAAAQATILARDPARSILDAQWPEGYWIGPGIGYSPKYKATVWQVIFLATMGAPRTEAIDRACSYVLAHSRLPDGRFSAQKTDPGAVACLNGNLLRAMYRFGYEDARLGVSLEALAHMVARDGFRCRFNARSPKPARMSEGLSCAWGAIKALAAFAGVPEGQRSTAVTAAIEFGITFLLSGDLVAGAYPAAYGPSPFWQQFGFPLGYSSDILEALQVLGQLGVTQHPRLESAVELVVGKRDERGRWALEHTPGKTWAVFGRVGQPNKWVTIRALQALKGWGVG